MIRLDGYSVAPAGTYALLNDAAQIDMKRAINKWKQLPRGDREIVYDNAVKRSRRGENLSFLIVALKATFTTKSEVLNGKA